MKRGDKPRRLMTKIRRKVGRPTMEHPPKTVYDRNDFKKEAKEIIEEECTCIKMSCICRKEEK